MYVIMVYDVQVERVARVLKIARRYLSWVQNSVLEGNLTRTQFLRLQKEVRQVIDEKADSVLFYTLRSEQDLRRVHLGVKKGGPEFMV